MSASPIVVESNTLALATTLAIGMKIFGALSFGDPLTLQHFGKMPTEYRCQFAPRVVR